MTASFGTLAWPPFWVCSAKASSFEKLRSAHFPASSRRALTGPTSSFGHLRTLRADPFELTLSRLLDDGLFHDHRTAATIYLRNGFPCRQRIERLAVLERFD